MKVAGRIERSFLFQGASVTTAASPRAHSVPMRYRPAYGEMRPIHLTPRERDVLSLLAEGLSNKLICRRLNIAPSTVKVHVARILAELGVSTRLQAVLAAQAHGLVSRGSAVYPDGRENDSEGVDCDDSERADRASRLRVN